MACEHKDFEAFVDINRMEDVGRYMADVKINCATCGVRMRFIGLSAGVDLNGATVSFDATEARLAIAPEGEVIPSVEGPQGFSIHRSNL